MAYIQPNSDILILKGIPLDSSYAHTVRYVSANTQFSDFSDFAKHTLTANTYQRVHKNVIRVALEADTLYDCNYMIFRNTNYGTKYFYAFIDKVEYINNATTEITYTIDLLQTFYFDYDLAPCFIEREHALTDAIGDNVVPEDIFANESLMIPKAKWNYRFSEFYFVVKYVPNQQYIQGWSLDPNTLSGYKVISANLNQEAKGYMQYGMYNGYMEFYIPIYAPLYQTQTRLTNFDRFLMLNQVINKIIEIQGTIVDIISFPTNLYDWAHQDDGQYTTPYGWYTQHTIPKVNEQNILQDARFFDEIGDKYYIPKNNKLYTSPFSQLVVSNNFGQIAKYDWEKFEFNDPSLHVLKYASFNFEGSLDPAPEISMYPTNYRNLPFDYESGLTFTQFPHATWSEDSFSRWWSVNKEAYYTSLYTGVMDKLAHGGGAVYNELSGKHPSREGALVSGAITVSDIISQLQNALATKKTHQNTPDQLYGQSATQGIQFWQGRIGYTFYDMGLEYDIAKTVDDYFTKYGYAQKKIGIPAVKAQVLSHNLRPYWNYVKTLDCLVIPKRAGQSWLQNNVGLSAEDKKRIEEIYNNGITFWRSLADVGDYELDNSIVEQGD